MKTLPKIFVVVSAIVLTTAFAVPGLVRTWKELRSDTSVFIIKDDGMFGKDRVIVAWEMLKTNAVVPGPSKFQPECNLVKIKGLIVNGGTRPVRVQKLDCVGKYKGFTLFSVPVYDESKSPGSPPLIVSPGEPIEVTASEGVTSAYVKSPDLIDTLTSSISYAPASTELGYQKPLLGDN